jgi:DeoR family L-fucose operon activator
MLAQERHRRILQLVDALSSVRTAEVARALGVAEETVRRDFEKLELEGRLQRTHGGALSGEASRRDLPFTSRETMNVAEKRAIARHALAHIQPGETILLDASSTALELARMLPDQPQTIVTCALKVAVELAARERMQVIMTGGTVNARSLSAAGPLSDGALDFYNIEKAFISCRGVDLDRGLSESDEEQARLKRRIVATAGRTILLADHTKLPLRSSYFFAGLGEVDLLVTDRAPEPEFAERLNAAGVKVEVALG